MAKSKLINEVVQDNIIVSEEVVAEVKKAVAPKNAYAIPELKEKDKSYDPGHGRRDFRN